jgi:tRNA threonylcarbamoyladenosine biosynthesis protein TsaE
MPIFHFDVFRLESPQEFEDLGVADYWNAGGVCLVEWADRVRTLLPDESWAVRIEPLEATRRRVNIDFPASANDLADRLANCLESGGDRESI